MSASLTYFTALSRTDLLAPPVEAALRALPWADQVQVTEIDPTLSDTAQFCEAYGVALEESVNCVVIVAKRGGDVTYAACMIAATTRANVNGLVRQHLGARKASFGPVDVVTSLTGMEYGGITPVGLPESWRLFVDASLTTAPVVIVGSGVRRSKLLVPGEVLAGLPGAEVVDGLGG